MCSGGGGGGMTEDQRYYQEQQLQLQKESLAVSQASLENSKNSVTEFQKSVLGKMNESTSATEQAAALRRGIASTFNRPTAFMQVGSDSATSGSSTKLGN